MASKHSFIIQTINSNIATSLACVSRAGRGGDSKGSRECEGWCSHCCRGSCWCLTKGWAKKSINGSLIMFRKSWAWHGIAMSLDSGLLRSHHRLMIVAFRWRHGNVWKCDTHRLSTNGKPSGSFKIMGQICHKENSVCSKFQMFP